MKNLGHWIRHHWLKLALVMTASSIVGTQVAAHHAFGAEFDPNRPPNTSRPGGKSRMGKPPRLDPYGTHNGGR